VPYSCMWRSWRHASSIFPLMEASWRVGSTPVWHLSCSSRKIRSSPGFSRGSLSCQRSQSALIRDTASLISATQPAAGSEYTTSIATPSRVRPDPAQTCSVHWQVSQRGTSRAFSG